MIKQPPVLSDATGAGWRPLARFRLQRRLEALWYGERTPPWTLRWLSALFGVAVRARRAAYLRRLVAVQRIDRPVIVVGNLTVGGSGKTPLVTWLCEQLREHGFRPGIVLRGYGGSVARGREICLVEGDSDPSRVGDEAVLLAQRTRVPVVVGRDRVRAARRLLEEGVNVVLADDGLQHLHLGRDLELAVIDASRGLGNGCLLPAGPLREPAARLNEVDIIVLNGQGSQPLPAGREGPAVFAMQLAGEQLWPLRGVGAPMPLSSLAGRRVHALAGIANPERFFSLLRAAGLQIIAHPFPDHHRYRPEELQLGDDLPLLMTEKDAVKCRSFGPVNGWFLPVTVRFPEAQAAALRERLGEAVARRGQRRQSGAAARTIGADHAS